MNRPSELPQKSPEKLPFELPEESLPESSSELLEELPKELPEEVPSKLPEELSEELPEMNQPKTATNEPFTEDETIVRKFGNTTYILTAKFKQGATEGLADKLLRLAEYGLEDLN